jgi:mannose-1-phosphate guanylyltransferase / mannose-6-phosphate isomerase
LVVYRPWGWYCRIDEADCYKVKRICVNPHQRLSLQRHQYRAEHWVVVKGVAKVTNGDETFTLSKDQSTYIPIGAKHRLANNTDEILELIEVQTGAYLGEDDIERFEDQYGRIKEAVL